MNRTIRSIVVALAAIVVIGVQIVRERSNKQTTPPPVASAPSQKTTTGPVSAPSASTTSTKRSASSSIVEAFRARRSNVWVEASGTVEAVLRDDNDGARHQKFIVRVSRDVTVLVSHNIDIAPRVPIDKGDDVVIRGEYIWNTKGGIVHWTHHDPDRRRDGGWIRVGDVVYE